MGIRDGLDESTFGQGERTPEPGREPIARGRHSIRWAEHVFAG